MSPEDDVLNNLNTNSSNNFKSSSLDIVENQLSTVDGERATTTSRGLDVIPSNNDFCRVCRGEGTIESPLFYPCLCSGSIKYVHQDCLVEWLRHSGKRYCELCKHPFAFSPIYRTQMPRSLPFRVLIRGIFQRIVNFVSLFARCLFLSILWGIFVPIATSTMLGVYFGWGILGTENFPLTPIIFIGSIGSGALMTGLMVMIFLSLMLLRDYMSTHRLFRMRRGRRPNPIMPMVREEEDNYVDLPNSTEIVQNEIQAPNNDDVLSETETMQTTFTAITNQTNQTNQSNRTQRSSSWLQNATPREYRAYLRRKELAKARSLAARAANEYATSAESPSSILSESNNIDNDGASVSPSLTDTSNTAHDFSATRSAGRTSNSRLYNTEPNQIGFGSIATSSSMSIGRGIVTMRDNFRCKICGSSTCVSKDHVIHASLLKIIKPLEEPVDSDALSAQAALNEDLSTMGESLTTKSPLMDNFSVLNDLDNSNTLYNHGNGSQTNDQIILGDGQSRNTDENSSSSGVANLTNPRARRESLARRSQLQRENRLRQRRVRELMQQTNAEGQIAENGDDGLWVFFPNNAGEPNNNNNNPDFSEFFGIKGSPLLALQSAFMVLGLNLLVMHMFVFFPRIIGRYLLDGLSSIIFIADGSFNYLDQILSGTRIAFIKNSKLVEVLLTLLAVQKGSTAHFALQVCTGYGIMAIIGSFYSSLMWRQMYHMSNAQRAAGQMLFLLGAFLKLFVILGLELVVFPIYCGWVIDACLLDLFDATLEGRLAFYRLLPLASSLMHWIIGTVVLVNVAIFVRWLRTQFRPGVLYFIRNADDPESLPLREIVERPLSIQIRRLIRSIVLYAIILFALFRGFSNAVRLLVPNLVPLKLSFRYASSEVPLDVIIQIFAKAMVGICSPQAFNGLMPFYLRRVARLLSLRSFLFGGRYLNEESPGKSLEHFAKGSFQFVPDADRVYKEDKVLQMAKRQVSRAEIAKIAIIEGLPMTEDSPPLTGIQDSLPEETFQEIYRGFTPVFCPGFFKLRMGIFCLTIWMALIASGLLFFAAPILLGRQILSFLGLSGMQHEIYTFFSGFLFLGVLLNLIEHVSSRVYESGLMALFLDILMFPPKVVSILLLLFVMLCVWPLLVGLYLWMVISPILLISGTDSLDMFSNSTLVTPIASCWLIGFLVLKIAHALARYVCTPERAAILSRLGTLEGWTNFRRSWLKDVYLRLLVPYSFRLVVMNVLPPLTVLIVCPMLGLPFSQIVVLQRWSFLLSLIVPFVMLGLSLALSMRRRLFEGIRNEAYLVGRQLHNLERPI